jgi:DNA-binding NtrC family response regulator
MTKLILIVDDDIDIRDTLALACSLLGFSVIVATNRDQALELMKTQAPDLILLDLAMPGLTIEPFLRHVSEHKPAPRIVLMTAWDAAATAERLQLKHHIAKPFDLDSLEQTIDKSLSDSEEVLSH